MTVWNWFNRFFPNLASQDPDSSEVQFAVYGIEASTGFRRVIGLRVDFQELAGDAEHAPSPGIHRTVPWETPRPFRLTNFGFPNRADLFVTQLHIDGEPQLASNEGAPVAIWGSDGLAPELSMPPGERFALSLVRR